MMSRATDTCCSSIRFVPLLLATLAVVSVLVGCAIDNQPAVVSDPDAVLGYLRSNTTLVVRHVVDNQPEIEVWFKADGRIIRGTLDGGYGNGITIYPSREDWEAVDHLRREWCATPPSFPDPFGAPTRYAVGLRCSTFDLQRVIVPVDQLPPALSRLFELSPETRSSAGLAEQQGTWGGVGSRLFRRGVW